MHERKEVRKHQNKIVDNAYNIVYTKKKGDDFMGQVSFNIRIDEDVKKQAEILYKNMGMTMTTAINTFIMQSIREKGFPFTPSTVSHLDKIVASLPRVGYRNAKGELVLPADMDNEEDAVYQRAP